MIPFNSSHSAQVRNKFNKNAIQNPELTLSFHSAWSFFSISVPPFAKQNIPSNKNNLSVYGVGTESITTGISIPVQDNWTLLRNSMVEDESPLPPCRSREGSLNNNFNDPHNKTATMKNCETRLANWLAPLPCFSLFLV